MSKADSRVWQVHFHPAPSLSFRAGWLPGGFAGQQLPLKLQNVKSQICPDIPREITAGSILFSVQHRPETVLIIKSGAVQETINMTSGRELRESQCLLCLSKVCLDLKTSSFSSLIYASEGAKRKGWATETERTQPKAIGRWINFRLNSWKDELGAGQLKTLQLLLPSAGDATGVWWNTTQAFIKVPEILGSFAKSSETFQSSFAIMKMDFNLLREAWILCSVHLFSAHSTDSCNNQVNFVTDKPQRCEERFLPNSVKFPHSYQELSQKVGKILMMEQFVTGASLLWDSGTGDD